MQDAKPSGCSRSCQERSRPPSSYCARLSRRTTTIRRGSRRGSENGAREKCISTLQGNLPASKKGRSGDIGEILATEFVNRELDFKVPIFRLRWRDDREMALRGDDILAVRTDPSGLLFFLKGEVAKMHRNEAS